MFLLSFSTTKYTTQNSLMHWGIRLEILFPCFRPLWMRKSATESLAQQASSAGQNNLYVRWCRKSYSNYLVRSQLIKALANALDTKPAFRWLVILQWVMSFLPRRILVSFFEKYHSTLKGRKRSLPALSYVSAVISRWTGESVPELQSARSQRRLQPWERWLTD